MDFAAPILFFFFSLPFFHHSHISAAYTIICIITLTVSFLGSFIVASEIAAGVLIDLADCSALGLCMQKIKNDKNKEKEEEK